ncbi:Rieske (2Fe-2S) protein [Nocardia ninae]|uniref:Rieske (2Fe-2S) protein n=1 Tax=Nocardia ninae TaxID=356145 RepID=UPI0011BD67CB|nr:Rieske (2Fe-2S) protein [Nocardia ninae]
MIDAPDSGRPSCSGCTRRSVLVGAAVAVAATTAAGCGRGDADTAPARVPLAEVPVGGGRIYPQQDLVVTQPVAGDIRVFSATCPHQGCLVARVRDGAIECACHGSGFSISDGSAVRGPARKPLSARTFVIEAAEIVVR